MVCKLLFHRGGCVMTNTGEKKVVFPINNNQKYSRNISDNVCLTCMFWTGYRKKEENSISSISSKTQGVCLWHANTSTEASFSCNHWVRKY